MAQRLAQWKRGTTHSKTHQEYWKERLTQRTYADADGRDVVIPEWQVRIAYRGRREWFNLNSANQAAAAIKARDIYLSLVASGWEATLAKFKPGIQQKAEVCTVGEFLNDVQARSHLKPVTIRRYAVKLRKMIADVAKLEAGLRGKAKRAKYDYVNGGRKAWMAKVDAQSLDVLTPETVASWRNPYVAKARENDTQDHSGAGPHAHHAPATIARIRRKLNASTPVFAAYLNVTPDTVRSWEKNRRQPSGPALLLLQIAEKRPEILLAS